MEKPRIEDYLKRSSTADVFFSISSVVIFIGVVAAIIAFWGGGKLYAEYFSRHDEFNFWAGLISAVVVAGSILLNGYLLKAVSEIVQNTENTSNYLRYQIDASDFEKSNYYGTESVPNNRNETAGSNTWTDRNNHVFTNAIPVAKKEPVIVNNREDLISKIETCGDLITAEEIINVNSEIVPIELLLRVKEKINELKTAKKVYGLADDTNALMDLSTLLKGN